MLGTLTLACNTCNPSLKCSRIIGNKVQTRIGCVRGRWVATVFDGFRRFSTVFDGFRRFLMVFNCFRQFSIVFNFFFFFFFLFNIILLLFSFLFCIPKTNYWFAWGYLGFASLPQQCEGHASRIMWGMSQTMVWGASWNLGQRIINAWDINPCL